MEMIPIEQVQVIAETVAKSGLFPDIDTKEKAFALMMLCQAEGLHPIQALKRYNIIQNRPAMKADAMLAEFNRQGGRVEWLEYNEKAVEAKFTHPNNTFIKIRWTIEMVKQITQAGRPLIAKDNWKNYPRQMLKARVISEGLRAIMPEVCVGIYTVEEMQDENGKKEELIPPKELINTITYSGESNIKPANTTICSGESDKKPTTTTCSDESNKEPITVELKAKLITLRKELGDEDYYYILKKNGYTLLKDIKTAAQAQKVIKAMESIVQGAKDESSSSNSC